ncbi:hypothetical protein MMC13_006848 [Lambiella insularis]|nr:hypothetical protein [Lambiella insularis]
MDFWSRLVGVTATPPKAKTQPKPNTSQLRLAHFKATYNAFLRIWRNGDGVSTDASTTESTCMCLRRMSELLGHDTQGATPHLCVTFAATSRLLVIVSRVASAFQDDGITHAALAICSFLIDSEEEAFLEDRSFANVLPDFAKTIFDAAPEVIDTTAQNLMLEVLFGIAARIRIQPEILPIWFRPKIYESPDFIDDETSNSGSSDSNRGSKDFPLFYLLLHYVPAEGRAGEFARLGLLYIIESAARSERLEKWLVESDMASFLASSLGALYSQLSRNLAMTFHQDEEPPILCFSDRPQEPPATSVTETTSFEYQAHLTTFLSSLLFWQDLLEHCTSSDVNLTLLDHFQFLFLRQLLYPSLLESSDVDGGTSVAVLTYLHHILESIDHPDLTRLILQYLFGVKNPPQQAESSARPTALARSRKSEGLLMHQATKADDASPDMFNLADLVLASLRSKSQQTLCATLRLLSSLLRKHHNRAQAAIMKTRLIRHADQRRTIGGQDTEVDRLLSMAEDIGDLNSLEDSYGQYLQDSRVLLEGHPCSSSLWSLTMSGDFEPGKTFASGPTMKMRVIVPEDPVLKALLAHLESFFQNDVETNLGLSQVLVDMASCACTRLEGWFLTDPWEHICTDSGKTKHNPSSGSDSLQSADPTVLKQSHIEEDTSESAPSCKADYVSPLFAALNKLSQQVELFRHVIEDFDAYLQECRVIVGADEEVGIASRLRSASRKPQSTTGSSQNCVMNTGQRGNRSERMRFERSSDGDSCNGSPRGRQYDPVSTPTVLGRLSHLHTSPSRSPSQNSSRAYSPSPLRSQPAASTPPKSNRAFLLPAGCLRRRIRLPDNASSELRGCKMDLTSSDASSTRSESVGPELRTEAVKEVSLGQLLTNVIILQEFILELAALVEVRAGLFEEARFP